MINLHFDISFNIILFVKLYLYGIKYESCEVAKGTLKSIIKDSDVNF